MPYFSENTINCMTCALQNGQISYCCHVDCDTVLGSRRTPAIRRNIQPSSSGSTNYVHFTSYNRAHINWPQHTSLTSTLKIAAVYSADMFVMHFQQYLVSEHIRPVLPAKKPLVTLCYYYNYTPCSYLHIISTYHYASSDTFRLHLLTDTRSR